MSWSFDARRFTDASWWHWVATVALLCSYVITWQAWYLYGAIALCAATSLAYAAYLQGWRNWPVQIRLGFLVLLLFGQLPGMWWIYYSQLCGVTAMLTVGYCPMHRMLLLMPWNRMSPLTWSSTMATFTMRPGAGGLLQYRAAALGVAEPVCSVTSK